MLRYNVRPLKNMVENSNESVKVLKNELLPLKTEADPMEALRISETPLNWDPATLRELVRVRKNEFFSVRLDANPRESLKNLLNPLV
jgi:hypothetical protein